MTYTFGDSDTAARRLHLLAEVYRPTTAEFLGRCAGRPRVAVDLGCGPGETTRLVHDVTGAGECIGLDASARFVDAAAPSPGIRFVRHDVTAGPLPVPPAGLLYCRFLLTHLVDPAAALGVWREAAAPDGRLLIEELEWLRSPNPVLSRYYELVALMQAHHGQTMSIGPGLGTAVRDAGWSLLATEASALGPAATDMATLHLLNLATWRDDAYIRESCAEAELADLADGLAAVARGEDPAEVDYGMRRIVAVTG